MEVLGKPLYNLDRKSSKQPVARREASRGRLLVREVGIGSREPTPNADRMEIHIELGDYSVEVRDQPLSFKLEGGNEPLRVALDPKQ